MNIESIAETIAWILGFASLIYFGYVMYKYGNEGTVYKPKEHCEK